MARYGATVNHSIVDNEPEDLVYQVTRDFCNHYCPASEVGPAWKADTSLFAIWIGINESAFLALRQLKSPLMTGFCSVHFSFLEPDRHAKLHQVLESYFRLVRELYSYGARRFLIINVPPTTRTPRMLSFDQSLQSLHKKAIDEFNWQLAQAVRNWRTDLDSVSFESNPARKF
jgi:phospholipase/lecithinase/hemolysin